MPAKAVQDNDTEIRSISDEERFIVQIESNLQYDRGKSDAQRISGLEQNVRLLAKLVRHLIKKGANDGITS